jgi:putative phosphoribosyl transferase
MFVNRTQAGAQLAEKLKQYLSRQGLLHEQSSLLVVGLPRGGVPVALEVSRKLGCPLEIIAAKKLPYPGQPEYAIGAVTSDGVVVLNPDIPQDRQWSVYIEQQRKALLERTMTIERQLYELAGREKSSFEGKTVVVVDDGIATGMTAMAALEAAKHRGARRTIMAVPVMSAQSYSQLQSHCDDIVAISVPTKLTSVGQYYSDFDQTSNDEVVEALKESALFTAPCQPAATGLPG